MKLNKALLPINSLNTYPGETWSEVRQNLETYLPALKQQFSPNESFGVELHLSNFASRELLHHNHLKSFQTWLIEQGVYVYTINGFSYDGFNHQTLKDKVYAPDWSKAERLDYTLRLVKILAALLPEGIEGKLSTIPLSYKSWWVNDEFGRETVLIVSTHQLAYLVAELVSLKQKCGRLVHIDLEPQPNGLLDNKAEVIDYFNHWLLPKGGSWLAQLLGISRSEAEQNLRYHIRFCHDICCHFAVENDQSQAVFEQYSTAGA